MPGREYATLHCGASDVDKKSRTQKDAKLAEQWVRIRTRLRAELGEDVFSSWFGRVELDDVNDGDLKFSVPTAFIRKWLRSHYYEKLLESCQTEWPDVEQIAFRVRSPHKAPDASRKNLQSDDKAGPGRPRCNRMP